MDSNVSKPNLICLAALCAAKLASVTADCLASASDRKWTNPAAAAPTRTTSTATTAKSACSGQLRLAPGAVARSGARRTLASGSPMVTVYGPEAAKSPCIKTVGGPLIDRGTNVREPLLGLGRRRAWCLDPAVIEVYHLVTTLFARREETAHDPLVQAVLPSVILAPIRPLNPFQPPPAGSFLCEHLFDDGSQRAGPEHRLPHHAGRRPELCLRLDRAAARPQPPRQAPGDRGLRHQRGHHRVLVPGGSGPGHQDRDEG